VSTGEKDYSKVHTSRPPHTQPSEVWRPEAWFVAVQKQELCQISWYLKTEEAEWILKSQILEKAVVKGLSGMIIEKAMPRTQCSTCA
jgi:hypothetical protein